MQIFRTLECKYCFSGIVLDYQCQQFLITFYISLCNALKLDRFSLCLFQKRCQPFILFGILIFHPSIRIILFDLQYLLQNCIDIKIPNLIHPYKQQEQYREYVKIVLFYYILYSNIIWNYHGNLIYSKIRYFFETPWRKCFLLQYI